MKKSLILQWKSLVSRFRYYPTQEEATQHVLKLINESFRRNIDYKHRQALSKNSTNHHLSSILDSPLLSADRVHMFSVDVQRNQTSVNRGSFQNAVTAVKDPRAYFEQQISMGSATIGKAKLCLDAQLGIWAALASTDPRQRMKDSRLGSLIYNWLWSSGLSDSMDYLDDFKFLGLLMPFLTVEAYQESLKSMLLKLFKTFEYTTDYGDYEKNLRRATNLMTHMINSEIQYGTSSQSALQLFLSVRDDFDEINRRLKGFDHKITFKILRPAKVRLVEDIMKKSERPEGCAIELAVFDRFLRATNPADIVTTALLSVYHPYHPNPSVAVPILRSVCDRDLADVTSKVINMYINLGLKTADVFSKQGAFEEADNVMQILRSKFALELGLLGRKPSILAREAPNLIREQEEVVLQSLNTIPLVKA